MSAPNDRNVRVGSATCSLICWPENSRLPRLPQGTASIRVRLVQRSLSPEFQRGAGVSQEGPLAKSTRVDQRAAKSETATLESEPVVQTKRAATKEEERLYSPFKGFVPPWRRWGPYLSARSW